MRKSSRLKRFLTALGLTAALPWIVSTQTRPSPGDVPIDADDIGGVVTGSGGPEAGVWVIAETTDLPTRFARIVVTDDQGRYIVPDLPKATYNVWVRGYGLVDSAKVQSVPGKALNMTAVTAPNAQAAAEYYPPNYWLTLMKVTGDAEQQQRMGQAGKCGLACHQMGGKATREISPALKAAGPFKTTAEAWAHRVRTGPTGASMFRQYGQLGPQLFPGWTDRIASGAVPAQPPRPQGVERNLVVSLWDWGLPDGFIHDQAPMDRRMSVAPPGTMIYGPGQSSDILAWFDPATNKEGVIKIQQRDTDLRVLPRDGTGGPMPVDPDRKVRLPSLYWGEEEIWNVASEPRSGQMDHKGRVWMGFRIRRDEKQPAYCQSGSTNKFAQHFPLDYKGPSSNIGGKQTGFYDPKTKQWSFVDVCWWFDHSDFDTDTDNTLFGGMNDVLGWVNTRVYDETHDDQKSIGWCPAVLDTNGDGKITKGWTEPNEQLDPNKDHRINFSCYSVAASPVDHAAWCNGTGAEIVRIERGPNPPETCKAEIYQVAKGRPETGSRGIDVATDGVVWVNFTSGESLGAFDRRKCKVLNGAAATGQHCPEGWTFYPMPETLVPSYEGTKINTDRPYLMNTDRSGTLGLGKDTSINFTQNADALAAYSPERKAWVPLRVPYPMGVMFTKKVIGRIDNPNTGWKGRGLWSNSAHYAIWQTEQGKGTRGKLMKFQVRPDPLAK